MFLFYHTKKNITTQYYFSFNLSDLSAFFNVCEKNLDFFKKNLLSFYI
jgi:hypothetical protein